MDVSAKTIIDKQRWWDILSRMMEVLQINLFIVDEKGKIILPPEKSQFGGKLIVDNLINIEFLSNAVNIPAFFKAFGRYFEFDAAYGLKLYAVPVNVKKQTIAYLVAGPVSVNRKLTVDEIEQSVDDEKNRSIVVDQISSIRVVSHMMVNSILDLLYEVLKNTTDLALSEKILQQEESQHLITHDQKLEAEKLYARVGMDEMLVTLLDVALKMTDTESGSIMMLDEEGVNLTVKAARGMDPVVAQSASARWGEGLAGMAAAHNEHYFIEGVQTPDNRIAHLLKRGDIRSSLVMPLAAEEKVLGVINLHTRRDNDKLEENIDNLRYLARLIASNA